MAKLGKFYSWEIVKNNKAIKDPDKTFINAGETGVPKEICWFFGCEDFEKGQSGKVFLQYKGEEFEGLLRKKNDDVGRMNLCWRGELHKLLQDEIVKKGNTASICFNRIGQDKYEIYFLDYVRVEEDENDSLESDVIEIGKEGSRKVVYTTKYERDPKLRKSAIKIHGTKCMACGFDFEDKYGELGASYIEVHHVKPLYDIGHEVTINPESDLACVCSNCHRMIHRKKNSVLTI